jgi:glycosyltransferase involved in cell wall biosynthesis
MEKPLLSVVLCTYNGVHYLRQQLDSILAQSYRPFELIISDDASTDGTIELLRSYQDHPQIRLFFQEKNLGLSANYSFASAHAKGELIAYADQDDIWMPGKLEKLAAAIGESPLVYSDSLLIDEHGLSLNKKLSDLKSMYDGTDSRPYIIYSCVWGHGMMVKRSLLERCLPIPPAVHHDIWITFQAFKYGGIKYHNEVLTHYRQYDSAANRAHYKFRMVTKAEKRYRAYKQKLEWITIMKEHERAEYQPFYERFQYLFEERQKKTYSWPLVFFMLRHRKKFFLLSKKWFLSNLVEIIKYGMKVRFPREIRQQENLLSS